MTEGYKKADASNVDITEMVVRRSTRYQQMSADERRAGDMRFADFMDEEVDIAALGNEAEDDDDCTYQPAEESDAETGGYVEINEDIDDDDDKEEENDAPETNENYYIAKDGPQWCKEASPTSRTRAHNLIDSTRREPGPSGTVHDPYTIFRSIISD